MLFLLSDWYFSTVSAKRYLSVQRTVGATLDMFAFVSHPLLEHPDHIYALPLQNVVLLLLLWRQQRSGLWWAYSCTVILLTSCPNFLEEDKPQKIFISWIFISGTKALLQPRGFLFAKLRKHVSKRGVKTSQTSQENAQTSFIMGSIKQPMCRN